MADEMRRFKGSDEKNPFEAMSERFDKAAQLLGLDADLYAVMRVPSRDSNTSLSSASATGGATTTSASMAPATCLPMTGSYHATARE